MNVRIANKHDLPHVIRMLKNFRQQTPIPLMAKCDNELYINMLYNHILHGAGLALVAEETYPIGLIVGVKDKNIWDPDIKILRELVYWVEIEHRGTSAGYRLLKEYNKQAQKLVDTKQIHMYTMTKMVNSPDLDFTRFGYKKTEEVWVGGI